MSHHEVTRHTSFVDLPEWLTIAEVAAFLGCSYWAVHQRVSVKREIPYRREGKFFLIPKSYFDPSSERTVQPEACHA